MDGRRLYQSEGIAEKCILPCEGSPRALLCAAPIIAAGDVTGVVALLTEDRTATPDAAQLKAVNVAAAFLARQMEVKNMPERFPYNKEGAFFVYDRIMNLLKHFSKGLDSTGKLAIMVLALRNKEC